MTDEALLESKITYLYNASAKELYSLALHSIGDQQLAEQLAIDAFVSAYNRLLNKSDVMLFRIKSARILYRITKKALMNRSRCSTRELNKHECKESIDDKNQIISMLSKLNYEEKFLLLLFCQQRFSTKQVAQILCVPKFIVKKRFCRIINKATNVWAKLIKYEYTGKPV